MFCQFHLYLQCRRFGDVLFLPICRRAGPFSGWARGLGFDCDATQVCSTGSNLAEWHVRCQVCRACIDESNIHGARRDSEHTSLHSYTSHRIQRDVANKAFRCAQQFICKCLVHCPEAVLVDDIFANARARNMSIPFECCLLCRCFTRLSLLGAETGQPGNGRGVAWSDAVS